MSVKVMSRVWDLNLECTKKIVLLKFADCANDEGSNAFPSVIRVSKECGISESTAHRAMSELRELGLLQIEREHDRGNHFPTTYSVHPERGVNLTPQDEPRGVTMTPGGVSNGGKRGVTMTPNPSLEPSVQPSSISSKLEAGSETPPNSAPPPSSRTPNSGPGGIEVAPGGRSGRGGGKAFAEKASKWEGPAPYLDLAKKHLGGYFAVEKCSRQLRAAEATHGRARVIKAYETYLLDLKSRNELRFASVLRFCEKVAVWLPKQDDKKRGYIPDNWTPPE